MTATSTKSIKTDKSRPVPTTPPDSVYRYQYTKLGANSNKWYVYKVWNRPSGMLEVVGEYARVGSTHPGIAPYGELTPHQFAELRRKREKSGYSKVELITGASTHALTTTSSEPSREHITALIMSEANESIATYLAGSVDQLSTSQIQRAADIIDSIKNNRKLVISAGSRGGKMLMHSLVEQYYNTIPTKLPPRIDPDALVDRFTDDTFIADEETKLQQLAAAVTSLQQQTGGGSVAQILGADIWLVPHATQEAASVAHHVTSTAGRRRFRVKAVYGITIPAERQAYLRHKQGMPNPNPALLFHGSANGNYRHILRSGLIIPRTATNGRAFGPAIYFGNKSEKSLNYTRTNKPGAPVLLLLCEVALGRTYPQRGGRTFTAPPAGYDSVTGLAGGMYGFDEIMVYTPTQQTARYLVELVTL